MALPYDTVVIYITDYGVSAFTHRILITPKTKIWRIRNLQSTPDSKPYFVHEDDIVCLLDGQDQLEVIQQNLYIVGKASLLEFTGSNGKQSLALNPHFCNNIRLSPRFDPEFLLDGEDRYCIFRWDMARHEVVTWLNAIRQGRNAEFQVIPSLRDKVYKVVEYAFDPSTLVLNDFYVPPISAKQIVGCFVCTVAAFEYQRYRGFVGAVVMNQANRIILARIMAKNKETN